MADELKHYTRVANGGLLATLVLAGVMFFLKTKGIMSFGPIPTLVLPLGAFVARAWWLAQVAPERMRERQRTLAIGVTVICLAALVFAGVK